MDFGGNHVYSKLQVPEVRICRVEALTVDEIPKIRITSQIKDVQLIDSSNMGHLFCKIYKQCLALSGNKYFIQNPIPSSQGYVNGKLNINFGAHTSEGQYFYTIKADGTKLGSSLVVNQNTNIYALAYMKYYDHTQITSNYRSMLREYNFVSFSWNSLNENGPLEYEI